ncbi:MFS transporter [Sulfuracidifex tepidarius]|uniref:Major facilitator superfamily (MFS) profile domain-containing protein n=1 Tax=Sulfuracidifex tepidarius TaxID=1294262 RepID=A0A510DYT0_9CREN|nr:MFS transporter [Sulfuracidifex tepidarius]BBG25385.1 hypothetical protein IC006_2720 [Sulfuracidifex tepidarius]BBG28179.1 hypothetical protein IC007_2734 [Sulfuracidifex tepidarius]
MRKFIGQFFITTALTEVSLVYPVHFYAVHHSLLLLGLITALYNGLNGIGSYLWGLILDSMKTRKGLLIVLSSMGAMSGAVYSFNGLIGYSMIGFISALDAPLYSLVLLETMTEDDLVRGNSVLSEISLAGNIAGSILASVYPNPLVVIGLFLVSLVFNMLFVPSYDGRTNANRKEMMNDLKGLYYPVISYFAFNLSAELFFTVYVPLNYDMGNPEYVVFLSYTILYLVDEFVYNKAVSMIKGKEIKYIYLSIVGRAVISLALALLVVSQLKIGLGIVGFFMAFGPIFPVYSTAFFSVVVKGLKRNRATMLGLLNSAEDIASIIGGLAVGVAETLFGAYMMSFYALAIAMFSFSAYLSLKRLQSKPVSPQEKKEYTQASS